MKVIVVLKKSTWTQYHQSPEQFGRMGKESLRRAKASHARHMWSVERVLESIPRGIKPWIVEGAETAFDGSNAQLVIAVGGDGTLLSASHHIGKTPPLLGVNSDPVFSRGHFCACTANDPLVGIISRSLDKPKVKKITRMAIQVGKKVISRRVLNEALFSHTCPAAMTRLTLDKTRYACSGVWVGTGAGSTGAIASAGGTTLSPVSKNLQAVIREHCGAKPGTSPSFLKPGFTLVSKTPDATLYLDGPFLRVPVGFDERVSFSVSPDHLSLVI